MSSVSMIVLCASALFVQTIHAQCLRAPSAGWEVAAPISWNPNYGAVNYGNIVGSNLASASGGGLGVISSSLYAPNGLSVFSENDISGMLDASGNLPVLAAVALEGSLPTSGSAGATYSCGNELVGIDSNSISAAGIDGTGYGAGYGPAFVAGAGAFGAGAFGAGPLGAGAFGVGALGTRALGAGTLGASALGAGALGASALGAGALGAGAFGSGAFGSRAFTPRAYATPSFKAASCGYY